MKTARQIILFLLIFFGSSLYGHKGAVTIGLRFEIFTRGGLSIGYFITDDMAIEGNFGSAIPPSITCGISVRYLPLDGGKNFYLLFGLADLRDFLAYGDSAGNKFSYNTSCKGFNAGAGYEININDRWMTPLEIGLFTGMLQRHDFTVRTRQRKIIEKRSNSQFSLRVYPILGGGINWYSRTE